MSRGCTVKVAIEPAVSPATVSTSAGESPSWSSFIEGFWARLGWGGNWWCYTIVTFPAVVGYGFQK